MLIVDDGEVMSLTINNQSSTIFPDEKLEAWQLAKALAGRVYLLTSTFDLGFLHADDYQEIRYLVVELVKKISALRASQLKRAAQ